MADHSITCQSSWLALMCGLRGTDSPNSVVVSPSKGGTSTDALRFVAASRMLRCLSCAARSGVQGVRRGCGGDARHLEALVEQ